MVTDEEVAKIVRDIPKANGIARAILEEQVNKFIEADIPIDIGAIAMVRNCTALFIAVYKNEGFPSKELRETYDHHVNAVMDQYGQG